ncbi:MAG: isopeptide-forming domain-containing fimbrial protein [Oscillospiraceae bacterium]|nr:isopeptide-forming domain-containing fimbrial protein [Oscillospiraceae bacterium]
MKLRKIIPLILALAMTLAFALPMSVSAAGENATLTINAPNNYVIDSANFTAYKLFDASASGENYSYVPAIDFTAFLGVEGNEGFVDPDLLGYIDAHRDEGDLIDLNIALTAFAKDHGFDLTKKTATQIDANSVKFTGLDYGYYLVVDTSSGGKGFSNLYTVEAPSQENNNNTVQLKVDLPTITDKQVSKDGETYDSSIDAKIGDTVYFEITTKVPAMEGYTSYEFIVVDEMSKGLSFNDDVSVTINAVGYASTNYDVTHNPIASGPKEGGTKIEIDFVNIFAQKVNAGKVIVITYSAVLTAAAADSLGADNSATLKYSNDPYDEGTGSSEAKIADVETFKLDILAYDANGGKAASTTNGLENAKFNLFDGAKKLWFIEDGGKYIVTDAADENKIDTLVSDGDGMIYIIGLDIGTYSLQETLPPEGFNETATNPIEIVISSTEGVPHIKVGNNAAEAGSQVNVPHMSGGILPGTGGIGAVKVVLGGCALMGLAAFGFAFFVRRKRRAGAMQAA